LADVSVVMSVIDTHVETLDELFRQISDIKDDNSKLEADLAEAESEIKEMKLQLVTVPNKQKKDEYLEKINGYQKLVNKYRKSLLTGGSSNNPRSKLTPDARGEDSLQTLKKAQAQLAETEGVGVNTLENLQKQKEVIKKVNNNTKEINDELSLSNKLLNRMGKWWRG
jgi:uncharacterized coiled-coil DUF342 family protein